MRETCNNCFGSKKCSTTLLQAKTGKHECRKITATYVAVVAWLFFRRKQVSTSAKMSQQCSCCYILALVLTCFRPKKGRATFFRPKTIVASFSHSMVLLPKVLFNHSWKHHFVVFHCHRQGNYSQIIDKQTKL